MAGLKNLNEIEKKPIATFYHKIRALKKDILVANEPKEITAIGLINRRGDASLLEDFKRISARVSIPSFLKKNIAGVTLFQPGFEERGRKTSAEEIEIRKKLIKEALTKSYRFYTTHSIYEPTPTEKTQHAIIHVETADPKTINEIKKVLRENYFIPILIHSKKLVELSEAEKALEKEKRKERKENWKKEFTA